MPLTKKRIDTINAILSGSDLANDSHFSTIEGEFREVYKCSSITKKERKHLLQVLHSTRAFDSSLRILLKRNNLLSSDLNALGPYLKKLTNHNNPRLPKLTESEKTLYMDKITNKRNNYMHKAGAFPNIESEVIDMISHMEACLMKVVV